MLDLVHTHRRSDTDTARYSDPLNLATCICRSHGMSICPACQPVAYSTHRAAHATDSIR